MNNYLFGPDSFDITGNHNIKVNIANEVATDRGGKWVFFNATKIVSDESFELTIALEPFILKVFWRLWKVLTFSSWIVLSLFIVYGLYLKHQKRDYF